MSARTPTNALTHAIVEYIHLRGGLAWRNNTGAFAGQHVDRAGVARKRFVRFGRKGSGDVLALFRGTFISVEVKTGRDDVRPEQASWMEDVERCGGVAIIARGVADVVGAINKLEGEHEQRNSSNNRRAEPRSV